MGDGGFGLASACSFIGSCTQPGSLGGANGASFPIRFNLARTTLPSFDSLGLGGEWVRIGDRLRSGSDPGAQLRIHYSTVPGSCGVWGRGRAPGLDADTVKGTGALVEQT
jgi:hypothetical protein